VWHHPYPLDELAMQKAAPQVIGEHDFTSFAAVDPERNRESDVEQAPGDMTNERGTGEPIGRDNVRMIDDTAGEGRKSDSGGGNNRADERNKRERWAQTTPSEARGCVPGAHFASMMG